METKHKFDKYGCVDENCKEHYPTISRATIINEMQSSEELHRKVDFSKVCWGIGKIGGGNLDVLRQATKVPGICDNHQQAFIEIIECNNCNVRLD